MREEIEKLIVDWLKSGNENATYLAHQIRGSLPELVLSKVIAEIEREYGKFSELKEERKDNFYLMLGIIDNALKK